MIENLFSNQVIALNATQEMWDGHLYPEEQECIRKAVPKRRREFTAGRVCAREVLFRLGVFNFPLLVGQGRAPLWPKNIVGSISHCNNLCVVAATKDKGIKGLGADVELAGPLEKSVTELVCTEKEMEWMARNPSNIRSNLAKIIFSAKESFYKSISSFIQCPLEFLDVQIVFNSLRNSFAVKLDNPHAAKSLNNYSLRGRYFFTEDYVYTAVEVRRPQYIIL